MSDFAGTRPLVELQDVAAKYAGLESTVSGLGKTVSDLTMFVRNENGQIRRDMAEQNQNLRHEMTAQNNAVINAIDKLAQTATSSNSSIRSDFTAEIGRLADKQNVKPSVLIGLGGLFLTGLALFINLNNRPTEIDIANLKADVARHDASFVPRGMIERMQEEMDRIDKSVVPREEHDRETALRDRINGLQDKITDMTRARTVERLDQLDSRLRGVEQGRR